MDADEFARGLCRVLLEDGLFVPDSIPHQRIMVAMKGYFPAVRAALVTELEQAAVVDQRFPQRPVSLPNR